MTVWYGYGLHGTKEIRMRTVEDVARFMTAGLVADGVIHANQVDGMTAFLQTVVSAYRGDLAAVRDLLHACASRNEQLVVTNEQLVVTNEQLGAINEHLIAANVAATTLRTQVLATNAALLATNQQLLRASTAPLHP
jgi:hypothetical protein